MQQRAVGKTKRAGREVEIACRCFAARVGPFSELSSEHFQRLFSATPLKAATRTWQTVLWPWEIFKRELILQWFLVFYVKRFESHYFEKCNTNKVVFDLPNCGSPFTFFFFLCAILLVFFSIDSANTALCTALYSVSWLVVDLEWGDF